MMTSNSFSSNLTYLCAYTVGYSVEPNNVIDYPVSIPKKTFLVKMFENSVVIKPTNSSYKTTLKLYRKTNTTSKNIIANHYSGNHYISDDITLDFSIFINPNLPLIRARLVNLSGTSEINFGFYVCAQLGS